MMMNGTYWFLLLLSNVLVITTVVSYRDDEEDSECCEKYNTCSRERNSLCTYWLDFLKQIQKQADDDADIQKLSFDVILTQTELENVKQILRSGNCPEEATFILRNFYPRFTWNAWLLEELKNLIISYKEIIGLITVILFIFLLLMYWLTISKSLWRAVVKMFWLIYIASIVMTCYQNYLKQLSKKRFILKDGIPLSCRPNDQGYFYSFWLFVKSHWSVMPDDCSLYYEADTMDPLFSATILDAVSETTTRFILTPVPLIFEYLGVALLKLFQTLPTYLWLPVTLGVFIIVILNVFMYHRYSLRTIFGSIEPPISFPGNQPALYGSSLLSVLNQQQSEDSRGPTNDGSNITPTVNSNLGYSSENGNSPTFGGNSQNEYSEQNSSHFRGPGSYGDYHGEFDNQGRVKGGFSKGARGKFGNDGGYSCQSQYEEDIQDTIFVQGLPQDIDEQQLHNYFGSIGLIKTDKETGKHKIWIYKDENTGLGKGEATITYADASSASSAIARFNGKELGGHTIKVHIAQQKVGLSSGAMGSKRGAPRGGRGGGGVRRGGSGDGIPSHDGDWKCPNLNCGYHNFAWHQLCNRCETCRPDSPNGGRNGGMRGGRRAGSSDGMPGNDGDWKCPNMNCKYNNLAWRHSCNQCQTQRPESTQG